MDTVLAQLKQGRKLISAGRGSVSPLIAVEAHFLVILQLASMHQLLTAAYSINFINSMILSSNLQDEVAAWKKKHSISGDDDNMQ
jgi:hypothetical protein